MSSNLACVGLRVDDAATWEGLIERILRRATKIGHRRGVDVVRWEDASGSRLVIEIRRGVVDNALPSFAGSTSTRLQGIRRLDGDVSSAAVVDDDGEQLTAMTIELEQRALLGRTTASGEAAIVALGTEILVFDDAEAFGASDASALGDPESAGDPPPIVLEQGWPWPPRMAAESFVSTGVFGSPSDATAHAILNGTVLHSQVRANGLTGQGFSVTRVRTAGFDVDLCLEGDEHGGPIRPGQVVAGTAFMVGSLDRWDNES